MFGSLSFFLNLNRSTYLNFLHPPSVTSRCHHQVQQKRQIDAIHDHGHRAPTFKAWHCPYHRCQYHHHLIPRDPPR